MVSEPFGAAIVGLDGRQGGEDAFALATQMVSGDGVLPAHVFFIDPRAPMFGPKPDHSARQQSALRRLPLPGGCDANTPVLAIEALSVGEGLHDLALAHNACLIVIGACERGPLGRVVIGDYTRSVLETAPCPVAVAPANYSEHPHELRAVGVAYDGSTESERALALARAFAVPRGLRLSALEVVHAPAYVNDPWGVEVALEHRIQEARDRITALGGIEARAVRGGVTEQLTRYSTSVDLLVVGARGYGRVGRLLRPSTSQRLARTTTCPLLVLPPNPSDPASSAAA
jgi:nucleotide-binding universal stress UspA family protein